jgi:ribosomal protein S27E
VLDRMEVDCPACGRGKVKFSLSDVANRRTVRCTRGCQVKMEDEGGNARRAQREVEKLDRTLKRLGRKLG